MTIMEKEKVIDKINKLLRLAGNNSSPEEANTAFMKAQELLLQHKIDQNELNEKDKSEIKIDKKFCKEPCNTPWAKSLGRIISKNFRCLYYFQGLSKSSITFCMFGEDDDVEIATTMYDYSTVWLNRKASAYATMMRNKYNIVKGVKQDFILGFLKGLEEKFQDQINKNNQFALVLVPDKEVKSAFDKTIEKFKKKQYSNNMNIHGSIEARSSGYHEGKNFSMNNLKAGKQSSMIGSEI